MLEAGKEKTSPKDILNRPVGMKKILGGGGYKLRNIVGHHGWPTKEIFHFKSSKT